MKWNYLVLLIALLIASCKKNETETGASIVPNTNQFSIVGNKILNNQNPIQLFGVNAFHVFGAGSADMANWQINIVREFVGNIKESPLTGAPILDSNGQYLHSLQAIVDSNRLNNKITILCPFGWNGQPNGEFTGKFPTQTYWCYDLKKKLSSWAIQFKNQPDVWIEVWNEPYRYDRLDGYNDEIWFSNMTELVSTIRSSGNNNIILVPCAEQGQDESVLLNKGASFLTGKTNILFDIHAYEKWLLVSSADMGKRLVELKGRQLPIFFGETAPMNAGVLMNPSNFLDSSYNQGLSVCAWVWKRDSADKDALQNNQGQPNDINNNNWGTVFKSFCLKIRKP